MLGILLPGNAIAKKHKGRDWEHTSILLRRRRRSFAVLYQLLAAVVVGERNQSKHAMILRCGKKTDSLSE